MVTIYTLTSSLHDPKAVEAATVAFLSPLGLDYRYVGDDFSSYGSGEGLELIFVRTGGTEGLFRDFLSELYRRGKHGHCCHGGHGEGHCGGHGEGHCHHHEAEDANAGWHYNEGAEEDGAHHSCHGEDHEEAGCGCHGGHHGGCHHGGPLERPFYLLASPTSNSLAASMEILSFLRLLGLKGEILHGNADYLRERICALDAAETALKSFSGKRLGIVGQPSDWLISSFCDADAVLAKTGVELEYIPIERLLEVYESTPAGPVDDLLKVPCREGTGEKVASALEGADRIYRALKQIISEKGLAGLTLRCFDLLSSVGNTGCLALARLNSEGFVATCEGDIPAMLSMMLARAVAGESGFQCNAAHMDPASGEIVFAHCTLPLSMASSYCFDTHFESGIGVGIHGVLPEGPVTLFKVSGDLGRSFVAPGKIVGNSYETSLCRTQVVVTVDDPAVIRDYFLSDPIGNHHILIPGNHVATLRALTELLV